MIAIGDILPDGGTVQSRPVDHTTHVAVVVRYDNGELRIRDIPTPGKAPR